MQKQQNKNLMKILFGNRYLRKYKKLKATSKYYEVQVSNSLFGTFYSTSSSMNKYTVLARNPREAVHRLRKRGISREYHLNDGTTTEAWAKYKIKEKGKPDNFRFFTYI